MATPAADRLAALIEKIQTAAQQESWEEIHSLLKEDVLRRMHEALDDLSEGESEPDAGLAHIAELTFFRDLWPKRKELPQDPADLARQVGERAFAHAERIAKDYRSLVSLLRRCKPDVGKSQSALDADVIPRSQVIKRLWALREGIKQDCPDFNAWVGDIAQDLARQYTLFTRAAAGDQEAMLEVYNEFRTPMRNALQRSYPEIPITDQEDILQTATMRLLEKIARGIELDKISTWKALVRTVVSRAGARWRIERGRVRLESEMGTDTHD